MKIWPLNVWEAARAARAQRQFLAMPVPLKSHPGPALWLRPRLPTSTINVALRRLVTRRARLLDLARYGNLHGSVGVELPLGPTEALRLASYRLRADWERPLSPDGRRRWAEAWLQLARRA